MKNENIQNYLKGLSDDELLSKTEVAYHDLLKASQEQNNSPWHEACFSALVLYSEEMGKRRLVRENKPEESFADRFLRGLIKSASEPISGIKEGHQSTFRIQK